MKHLSLYRCDSCAATVALEDIKDSECQWARVWDLREDDSTHEKRTVHTFCPECAVSGIRQLAEAKP